MCWCVVNDRFSEGKTSCSVVFADFCGLNPPPRLLLSCKHEVPEGGSMMALDWPSVVPVVRHHRGLLLTYPGVLALNPQVAWPGFGPLSLPTSLYLVTGGLASADG